MTNVIVLSLPKKVCDYCGTNEATTEIYEVKPPHWRKACPFCRHDVFDHPPLHIKDLLDEDKNSSRRL